MMSIDEMVWDTITDEWLKDQYDKGGLTVRTEMQKSDEIIDRYARQFKQVHGVKPMAWELDMLADRVAISIRRSFAVARERYNG